VQKTDVHSADRRIHLLLFKLIRSWNRHLPEAGSDKTNALVAVQNGLRNVTETACSSKNRTIKS